MQNNKTYELETSKFGQRILMQKLRPIAALESVQFYCFKLQRIGDNIQNTTGSFLVLLISAILPIPAKMAS